MLSLIAAGWPILQRLPTSAGERLPLRTAAMLGEHHDLSDMIGVMAQLAKDGVDDVERTAADRNLSRQVLGLQLADRRKEAIPAFVPFRALSLTDKRDRLRSRETATPLFGRASDGRLC